MTEIYRHPEFKTADILLKDGTPARASVNYNSLHGEMQFIDPKGDTLSVADEKNIKWLGVEKDSFYFATDGWN